MSHLTPLIFCAYLISAKRIFVCSHKIQLGNSIILNYQSEPINRKTVYKYNNISLWLKLTCCCKEIMEIIYAIRSMIYRMNYETTRWLHCSKFQLGACQEDRNVLLLYPESTSLYLYGYRVQFLHTKESKWYYKKNILAAV